MDPIVWLLMLAGAALGASAGASVGSKASKALREADPNAHQLVCDSVRSTTKRLDS